MTTLDGIPLFKGEAMLLSWGDTSSRGKTVTFALHEDDCGASHPFRDLGTGKHGQRFQIVAVPITDEGEPVSPGSGSAGHGVPAVDQAPRSTPEPGGAKRERTLPEKVGMRCCDKRFQEWLYSKGRVTGNEHDAAQWVRHECGVKSRKEILPGTEAGDRWWKLETQYLVETNQIAEERR